MSVNQYIFRGRYFNEDEIRLIQRIVEKYYSEGRKAIARVICERISWCQVNGRLKIVSCLEALRRMSETCLPRTAQAGRDFESPAIKPPRRLSSYEIAYLRGCRV